VLLEHRSKAGFVSASSRLAWVVLAGALMPLGVMTLRASAALDFWWNLWMTLGVVCVGGAALLPLLSARWWARRQRSISVLRVVQRLHRDLAWWLCGFAVLHVGGLLWLEPRTLDYLLLSAPGYMLAGLAALMLLLTLNITSLGVLKRRWPQTVWRGWHAVMSVTALAAMVWHLLGSGYYFADLAGRSVLLWSVAVPSGLAIYWHLIPPPAETRRGQIRELAGRRRPAVALAIAFALFVAAVWLAQPITSSAPAATPYPCPAGRCL
jgi:hypothetical protein